MYGEVSVQADYESVRGCSSSGPQAGSMLCLAPSYHLNLVKGSSVSPSTLRGSVRPDVVYQVCRRA